MGTMSHLSVPSRVRRLFRRASVWYLVIGVAYTTSWWWGDQLHGYLSLVWLAGAVVLFVCEQRELARSDAHQRNEV